MAYQALYRAFRPQTFQDVVGQQVITKTLQNALLHNKVSHAYLFSGSRGTGKTSVAKIFAKAINCEEGNGLEPCNACSICCGITDGSLDDVLEIDAASNNGVDEIRELREKVKYAPTLGKYKVYIIDEVHMLSTGAFNALLKTLEEPPKHVIFILATTEPHKIPLTIISRTQRFDFKKVDEASMLSRMKYIVEAENLNVEEDALKYIALISEGGMRDALSILDQALSFSSETTTLEDVLNITGGLNQKLLLSLANAIARKDGTHTLTIFHELLSQGKEAIQMLEQMLYFYRDVLVQKSKSSEETSLLIHTIYTEDFADLVANVSVDEIYTNIGHLQRGISEARYGKNARLIAEMTLLKMCCLIAVHTENVQADHKNMESVVQLQEKIEKLEQQLQKVLSSVHAGGDVSQRSVQVQKRSTAINKAEYKVNEQNIFAILKRAEKERRVELLSVWGQVQAYMRSQGKVHLFAIIERSEIVAASNTEFLLAFQFPIHAKMAAESQELHQELHRFLEEKMKKSYQMVPLSKEQWVIIRESFMKSDVRLDESKEEKSFDVPEETEEQANFVDQALQIFGEDLVRIEE